MSKGAKSVIILVTCLVLIAAIGCTAVFVLAKNKGTTVEEQLILAEKYIDELDYEKAIVAYEKALEIDPMSIDAHMGIAEVYVVQEEYLQAFEHVNTVYELTKEEQYLDKMVEIEEKSGEELGGKEILREIAEEEGDSEILKQLVAGIPGLKNEVVLDAQLIRDFIAKNTQADIDEYFAKLTEEDISKLREVLDAAALMKSFKKLDEYVWTFYVGGEYRLKLIYSDYSISVTITPLLAGDGNTVTYTHVW